MRRILRRSLKSIALEAALTLMGGLLTWLGLQPEKAIGWLTGFAQASEMPGMAPILTHEGTRWLFVAVGLALIALAVFYALASFGIMRFREVRSRAAQDVPNALNPSAPQRGDVYKVTSDRQSGGITAGKIVNQAARPQLRVVQQEPVVNSDGSYTTVATLDVDSPYPPAELFVQARSTSILEFDCSSERVGMMLRGWSGSRPDGSFTTINNPSGRYKLTIRASEPTKPKIEWEFS